VRRQLRLQSGLQVRVQEWTQGSVLQDQVDGWIEKIKTDIYNLLSLNKNGSQLDLWIVLKPINKSRSL